MGTFITIPTDEDGWKKAMRKDKCTCGHELYLHAFVVSSTPKEFNDGTADIRTSQCIKCGYDRDTGEFECNGFVRSE